MFAKFTRKSAPKSPASRYYRYCRYAVHAVLIAVVVGATEITPTRHASAQTSATEESVLTLYQLRISAIEQSLKELNARFEDELFELRETVEGNDVLRRVEAHLNELGNIGNEMRTLSNKIERVLEIAASNEFRIEQLEARLDSTTTAGVPSATGGGTAAIGVDSGASGQRPQRNQFADLTERDVGDSPLGDSTTSGVRDLTATLDNTAGTRSGRQPAQPGSSLLGATSPDSPSNTAGNTAGDTNGVNSLSDLLAAPVSILPEGTEEDQYQYALDLALKNRLMDAEEAFAALVELYPQGARNADSMYWLGRIQFLRGAHQEAVISLSAFGQQYPDDPRRVETTMWTAESLAEFAPQDQACAIFARLLDTFSTPPEQLVTRLDALKRRVGCN